METFRIEVGHEHGVKPGNIVGNGPFRIIEWTPNSRVVAEKNPDVTFVHQGGLEGDNKLDNVGTYSNEGAASVTFARNDSLTENFTPIAIPRRTRLGAMVFSSPVAVGKSPRTLAAIGDEWLAVTAQDDARVQFLRADGSGAVANACQP